MLKNSKAKKWLTIGIPAVFYTLLAIFLVVYLQNIDFSQLQNVTFSWHYIAIATVVALAFRYWGAFIWFVLLKGLGAKNLKPNLMVLIYVYAKSWLGRYIPGTAPWILGKIYFASKQGISKNKLAVSSLLEGGLQIVVLMAISLIFLLLDGRLNVIGIEYKILLASAIAVCFIALIPKVFNSIIAFTYKLIKKKTFDKDHYVTGKLILRGSLLYVGGALLSGLSLFFIAKAVYPELAYENIFYVMGAANIAAAVSMLAFFAPSGLGVREGIQLLLFSIIMPTEIALVIIVITRLWSIVVDILFFGLGYATRKLKIPTRN
jgi:uncharacterized membrane protein YbhN (UPF0104 family)